MAFAQPEHRASLVEWLDSLSNGRFEQADYYVNNIEAMRRRDRFQWEDLLVATALPERNRKRLIGFLGRLASDRAAERTAAVEMMTRVRKGVLWDDLIVGRVDPPIIDPPRRSVPKPPSNDNVNKVAGWVGFCLCMLLAIYAISFWTKPVPQPVAAPHVGFLAAKPPETPAPSSLFATAPAPKEITWRGSYSCQQGETALHLAMQVSNSGSVSAVAEFGPTVANPRVPKGAYSLRGTIQHTGLLHLEPVQWITQPPGFVLVGFSGYIVKNIYRGAIDVGNRGAINCTTFSVMRAN